MWKILKKLIRGSGVSEETLKKWCADYNIKYKDLGDGVVVLNVSHDAAVFFEKKRKLFKLRSVALADDGKYIRAYDDVFLSRIGSGLTPWDWMSVTISGIRDEILYKAEDLREFDPRKADAMELIVTILDQYMQESGED